MYRKTYTCDDFFYKMNFYKLYMFITNIPIKKQFYQHPRSFPISLLVAITILTPNIKD
jgi:hypothetical protein